MRTRMIWLAGWSVLGVGGFIVLAAGQGQDRSSAPQRLQLASPPRENPPPARDLTKLSPLKRQMDLAAQRGADWLFRANQTNGRFTPGHIPALQKVLEGEHYPWQVGAAFALARAARYTGNEKHVARARQAVLTLLLDTAPDPQDPRLRHTTLPAALVNRLGAAGLLVLAINELPSPGDDLLDQSEQLCAFIARQQQADGSLAFAEFTPEGKPAPEDPEGVNHYPGQALYGLMRSQQYRPAPWKTDVVRKALSYYRSWWKAHPSMEFVPWQTAAYTEAYLQTKEKAFADAVFEMTDWICGLQYVQLDSRHPLWIGGFMSLAGGRPAATEPQVLSASYAEGLAEACHVARQAGEVARYQRYAAALRRGLQFLTTLQYTDANTTHFVDWYKPAVLGGFHASHQDGNLRLDYNQHAVCALVQYLTCGAE